MNPMPIAARRTIPTPAVLRPDLYAPVHERLRHARSGTLVRVSRMGAAAGAELRRMLDQVDALLELCEGQLQIESAFIHPFIESRAPQGMRRIAAEHDTQLDRVVDLRDEANAVRSATGGDRAAAASRLVRHPARFVADQFRHLHVEETAHHALPWQRFDDAELCALLELVLASSRLTPAGFDALPA